MNNLIIWKVCLIIAAIAGLVLFFFIEKEPKPTVSSNILDATWEGYKRYFIDKDGRVKRPKESDTVSEGQAYAMLRAVWMNDKATFDRVYRWTEINLSRQRMMDDHLLAWLWKSGQVNDWMPASDADIDYALSLIMAQNKWGQTTDDLEPYGIKAEEVLRDILNHLTFRTESGRLYLSPWILTQGPLERFPINPSYYSPAHFRVFYKHTRDERWLELVDTTYFIVHNLSDSFNGQKGVGLIPDWVSVDHANNFAALENRNSGFGWEAVRVFFRLALDELWFDAQESKDYFSSGVAGFIENEWAKNGIVYCEYDYNGSPARPRYDSPLYYAAYYITLSIEGSPLAEEILAKLRSSLIRDGQTAVYSGEDEYYINSWAWMAEAWKEQQEKK